MTDFKLVLKYGVSQAKCLFRRFKGVCGLQGDVEGGAVGGSADGGVRVGVHVGLPLLRPQGLLAAGLSMHACEPRSPRCSIKSP